MCRGRGSERSLALLTRAASFSEVATRMLQLMPRSKCDGAEKNGAADISCRRWGRECRGGGDGEEVVVVTKAGTGVDEGDVLEESLKGTRRQKMGLFCPSTFPHFCSSPYTPLSYSLFYLTYSLPPIAQFDCHTAKTARLQYNGYRTLCCIDHRASSPPPQTQQLLVSGLTLAAKSTSSSNLDRTELRIPLHDSAGSANTDNGTIRRNLNCEELLNSCRRVWWRHVTRPRRAIELKE